ncbi:hypothetical protein CN918_26575 [Priestia megaterium]|nr:hypothetical protein CN918_26575 [Priestia megaterium]
MIVALGYFLSIIVSMALIRFGFWLDSSNAKINSDSETLQLWFFVTFIPGLNAFLPLLAVLYLIFKRIRLRIRALKISPYFFTSFLRHLFLPSNYHK